MFAEIRRDLEAKLKHANRLIETAREAKILSDRAICAIHSEKKKEADSLLNGARLGIKKLNKDLVKYPELYATNMQINLAFQEYAEAEMLVSILAGRALPVLDMPGECYLTGLADCVGELNRSFLQFLMKKDYRKAGMVMEKALEINDILKEFDYPDFVALNLRRKKDAVRIIVNNMLAAQARSQS